MGDRCNVFIQQQKREDGTWEGIGIYSHWDGEQLHEVALAALPKAAGRVGDPAYFARIIVHNVFDKLANVDGETGYGLWTDGPCDNDGYKILVINAETGEHWKTDIGRYHLDKGARAKVS